MSNKIIGSHRNYEENISKYVIITAPANGLALSGARTSAGTVMTKFRAPIQYKGDIPDNKVHGANMEPTWVLSPPDGPHAGPMKLAIRDLTNIGNPIVEIR